MHVGDGRLNRDAPGVERPTRAWPATRPAAADVSCQSFHSSIIRYPARATLPDVMARVAVGARRTALVGDRAAQTLVFPMRGRDRCGHEAGIGGEHQERVNRPPGSACRILPAVPQVPHPGHRVDPEQHADAGGQRNVRATEPLAASCRCTASVPRSPPPRRAESWRSSRTCESSAGCCRSCCTRWPWAGHGWCRWHTSGSRAGTDHPGAGHGLRQRCRHPGVDPTPPVPARARDRGRPPATHCPTLGDRLSVAAVRLVSAGRLEERERKSSEVMIIANFLLEGRTAVARVNARGRPHRLSSLTAG